MPILPENRERYPPSWPEISRRIREERAGGRCECMGQCGIDHAKQAAELELDLDAARPGDADWPLQRCQARHGGLHPQTGAKVVLTVMHLDHAPENLAEGNLLAGCQLCHNRYDAPHRRETRRRRKALGDLFEGSPP